MALFPHAACLQMEIQIGDTQANLNQVQEQLASKPQAADTLVVLPELWATGFDYPRVGQLASQTPQLLAELHKLAARHSLWFAGSLLEERKHGPPCNTMFVTGPAGVVGKYRKHHLFSFWKEERFLQPGLNPQPIETPFGPLGALVCYDLRFPEISRSQTFAGCSLIVISAQWPTIRLDHWQLLVQARAVENQAFTVACNGCGDSGGNELAGHSMIVDPAGKILCQADTQAALINADLVEGELETLRSRFCTGGERPWPGFDRCKVVEPAQLRHQLAGHRQLGSKIVFTNGCFDILHAGHVSYLEQARRFGDCLVIGLNSDRSVRELKGNSRPVNSEQDRARVLAALGCVDYIVIFDEDTPRELISDLLPAILVKGADWPENQIAGAEEVKAAGGRVERIVFDHQISTSTIITRIKQQNDAAAENTGNNI